MTTRNIESKNYASQREEVLSPNLLRDSQPASPESHRYSAEELEKQLLDSPTWKHRQQSIKFEPFTPGPKECVPAKKSKKKKRGMQNISLFSQKRDMVEQDDESLNDFENYVMYKQDSSPSPQLNRGRRSTIKKGN